MLFYLCNIFYPIVKRFSLIRGCKYVWFGQTTLKPRASLCELFYLFVIELILSTLKLPLAQPLVSKPRFRLGHVGEILECQT